MELPKYQKSFNKVINEALFYGLDELHKQLFEEVEMISENLHETKIIKRDGINDQYFAEVVKFLKEVILNVTINKSILCSLFNVKCDEYNHQQVDKEQFNKGLYRDTPEFLSDYEIRELKKMRKGF